MWKFFEDLKNDFEKGVDDIADEQYSPEERSQAQQQALDLGKTAIEGTNIVALQDGTVEMINQDQDEVEIYFDNGHGYAIQFPFGPTGYTVMVRPNEKVHKGQKLISFGVNEQNDVRVFAFTPDMIKVLSQSRFRVQ